MAEEKGVEIVPGNRLIPSFEPAYPSMPTADAARYEQQVKSRYDISDWVDPKGPATANPGWSIKDRLTGTTTVYSANARAVTTKEYLRKGEGNRPTENVLDLVARVAVNVATAERKYDPQVDIAKAAEVFMGRILRREFAPNTPTFANAGGHLQQLAACFGMIPEDYLGTDDIGEDPEKQGNGIFDIARYGAIIQKSGGGTGYNFSLTRPKNSGIATTGGRASGPVSWLKAFNGITQEINQGGFRRGANMGVLEYQHPDVFEFLSAKANHKIPFFNLSLGTDEKFWDAFEKKEDYYLVSPKDMNTVPEEQRRLKGSQLLKRADFEKMDATQQGDWDPSLLVEADGKTVVVRYTGKKVGSIDQEGFVKISATATLEYAADVANRTGCPGLIFFDRMNRDNPTPHIGPIRVVNPCGEQPLLNFEACNLGSVNLYACIENVPAGETRDLGVHNHYFYGRTIGEGDKKFQTRLDLTKLEGIVNDSVHFLDNVIDMGKYPFRKVYANVKANRKIGLGIMGLAEAAAVLGVPYESEDMEQLSGFISGFMSRTAFAASQQLAESRGVFPNWEGSIYDPNSPHALEGRTGKVRNATRITIAPNGTTGRFADVSGGGEPMVGIVWNKNLANGVSLRYTNQVFEDELRTRGLYSEELMATIAKAGSLQGIKEIPDDMKARYKLMTEVSPQWHVRIQGALQRGQKGWGVDNAVSKTVNLPRGATAKDFMDIFMWAREYGCKGVTGYRDGTIAGQPLTFDNPKDKDANRKPTESGLLELVRVNVPIKSGAIKLADSSNKYRVERGEEAFHIVIVDELRKHSKTGKVYHFPREIFQQTAPLGDEIAVEFASAGLDRTNILKEDDPDYAKLVERWKSVTGNRSAGLGPNRINSPTHAVGLVAEHAFLSRGILEYDGITGKLTQTVRKKDTVKLTDEEKKAVLNNHSTISGEVEQQVTNKKVGSFLCADCGATEYVFAQGCHEPKCSKCGWTRNGDCS